MPGAVRAARDSNNPLDAWRSLAPGVDQINEQLSMGLRPVRALEYCASCGHDVGDTNLQPDFDNRLVSTSQRAPSALETLVRGYDRCLRKEFKRSVDVPRTADEKEVFDAATAYLEGAVDGAHYRDDYASSKMRDMPVVGDPTIPNVDACHRSLFTAYGQVKHVLGNLVVTTRAANEGKYTHLVGMIQSIADYYRDTGSGPMSTAQLHVRMNELLIEVQEMSAIKIKHAYLDSTRASSKDPSAAEKQARQDGLKSGKLSTADADTWRTMGTRRWDAAANKICNLLDDEARAGIRSVYLEICQQFGHIPVYGHDERDSSIAETTRTGSGGGRCRNDCPFLARSGSQFGHQGSSGPWGRARTCGYTGKFVGKFVGMPLDALQEYNKFILKLQNREHDKQSIPIITQSGSSEMLGWLLEKANSVPDNVAIEWLIGAMTQIAARLEERKD
ncbi:hypothetical protein LTR95_011271 [Oleoguttula sp. CCFEE 5521]